MESYIIRRLAEADVPEAMELVRRVFMEFEAPEYLARGVAEFEDFIAVDALREHMRRGMILWGCYVEKDVVGVLALRPPAHISLLFVDKQYHGRGLAKALLAELLAALGEGVDELTVNSSPYALEIYRHMGFAPTSAEQLVNGIRFIPMKKILTGP